MAEQALEKHKCPECDREFDTLQGLQAHRARTHGYRRDGVELATEPRPDDQGTGEPEQSYHDRVWDFLPALSKEIKKASAEEFDETRSRTLIEAFFILYDDAH